MTRNPHEPGSGAAPQLNASPSPAARLPEAIDPTPWLERARNASDRDVSRALSARNPDCADFAALLSPRAGERLEELAQLARSLTRTHFGRAISLYVPLYLSNHCQSGCEYCGFASDRKQTRTRMDSEAIIRETTALKSMGFEDALLLTGERCPEADFGYLLDAARLATERLHAVAVESFAMSVDEYRALNEVGCTGVTLYQETYDPALYERLHRWGPKRDYAYRLDAPARALEGGLRVQGLGALFGLGDPVFDALALFRHAIDLRRRYWRAGLQISFPRIRPEQGAYHPAVSVADAFIARMIFAFRLCMPDVSLALSTRESARFRDGIAGIGINRMSIASRTSVGGYGARLSIEEEQARQFEVSDARPIAEFCDALRGKGLDPIFKNWDSVFSSGSKFRNEEAG